MRIVYFGSGAFGLPTLEHLARHHHVLAVVTQPDKPAGRGSTLTPTPIGHWAALNLPSTPLLKPLKCREPAVVDQIRAFPADAWVVIAYGQKLPAQLLEGRFAINLHASLLPRWRGAAPINAAILGGDTVTGNSVITLADRMDAGLVLAQTNPPLTISEQVTAGELHDLLASDGPGLVERTLALHSARTLQGTTQDESLVTIASKLSKDDDHIDFAQAAPFLRRQIHALTPWPGITAAVVGPAWPDLPGPEPIRLKILRVQSVELPHAPSQSAAAPKPGTLLDHAQGLIQCGSGSILQLLTVQPPGKRAMPYADFARGRTLPDSAQLISAKELA